MSEQLANPKTTENKPAREIQIMSGGWLAGIYRAIPELTLEFVDNKWAELEEASPYTFRHTDGSSFEISLSESEEGNHIFEDGTPADGLSANRKVLVRHDVEGTTTAEAAIDSQSGYFIAKSHAGVLAFTEEGGQVLSPAEGYSENDVILMASEFSRGFVASTPEYCYPRLRNIEENIVGATAVSTQVETVAPA